MRYKQYQFEQLEGQLMPEPEVHYVEAQFDQMDVDLTGTIDWYEFLHFESRKCLASKPEVREIISSWLVLCEPVLNYRPRCAANLFYWSFHHTERPGTRLIKT